MADTGEGTLLWRVRRLEQELEYLKRDLLKQWTVAVPPPSTTKPSLFGTVRSGEVSEEMIEEAKRQMFRDVRDL